MLSGKKHFISICCALVLAMLVVTGVWAVTVEPWFWAGAVTNLSESADVRPNVSLAAGTDDVAVAWAGAAKAPGIYLAHNSGSVWNRSVMTTTDNQTYRYPALVLNDGQPLVVWSQSAAANPVDTQMQTVWQQDGIAAAQKITGFAYGRVVPDMKLADTGLHLVYPAASTSLFCYQHDLYYAHRYLTETNWTAPTLVLTHAQVLPANVLGQIALPKLTVSADGQTLHVVWEQYKQYLGQKEIASVWYMSGAWSPDGVIWGTPKQVSPEDQDFAVYPNILASDTGKVHIVWTELIFGSGGGTSDVEKQQINYVELSDLSNITEVNLESIEVNNDSPTWASSTIGLYKQNLCIAWHGFYAGEWLEEITLRCSKDEGSTWLSLMNVSASPDLLSDFPVMAFDSTGLLHIAWEDLRLDGAIYKSVGIYYRGGLPQHPTIFLPLVVRQGL